MERIVLKGIVALMVCTGLVFQVTAQKNLKSKKVAHHKAHNKHAKAGHHKQHTKYKHLPRKGTVLGVKPKGAVIIKHANVQYHYHNGSWYKPKGKQYIVCRPAVGVRVKILPIDPFRFTLRSKNYYYHNGTYYQMTSRREYIVVKPPIGASVDALPNDFTVQAKDGMEYYKVEDQVYEFDSAANEYKLISQGY